MNLNGSALSAKAGFSKERTTTKKEQIFMFREIYFGLLSIESATERVVRSFTAFFGIIH